MSDVVCRRTKNALMKINWTRCSWNSASEATAGCVTSDDRLLIDHLHADASVSILQQPQQQEFLFQVNWGCITYRLTALCPGLPRWAGSRKVEPIWILLKQETASRSGISWAICKSAPSSTQITTPEPHHSVFTGRMPFLLPNQQSQSTEGNLKA